MKAPIATRHGELHGVLTVGCGRWAPLIEAKTVSNAGSAVTTKMHYQTQPKGGQCCAACVYAMAAMKTCQRLEGAISLQGWCHLWAAKA